MSARVFVALRPRNGQRPQVRTVLEGGGADTVQHRLRNADIGNLDLAAMEPPRQQQMARLLAEEGDRERRAGRMGQHRAAVSGNATRQVNRHQRQILHRFQHLPRRARDRPFQPGPEQGVDDESGIAQRRGTERLDRSRPGFRRLGCIARERLPASQQRYAHRPAGGSQPFRRDEAVAAIVAGPRQHQHGPRTPAPAHRVCDGGAGIAHQFEARMPVVRRQPVGPPHLLDRQQGRAAAHCGNGWFVQSHSMTRLP